MFGGVLQPYDLGERKRYWYWTWLEGSRNYWCCQPLYKNFPYINLFHYIDLLLFELKETNTLQSVCCLSVQENKIGYSPDKESFDSDSDWKIDDGDAFDLFSDPG